MQRCKREYGFTIVELMIVLVVSAVLVSMAVPAFSDFLYRNQLNIVSRELVNALQGARERAVTLGENVAVAQDEKSVACSYTLDGDTSDCVGFSIGYDSVSIEGLDESDTADENTIIFDAAGKPNSEYNLVVRHSRLPHSFVITVMRSGRVDVEQKNI